MMNAEPRIDTSGQQQGRSVDLAGQLRNVRKRIFQWMRKIGLTGFSSATVEARYVVENRADSGVLFSRLTRTYVDTDANDAVLRLEEVETGKSAQVMRIHAQEEDDKTKLRTVLIGLRPGTGVGSTIDAKFADATLTGYNPPIQPYRSAIIFHRINRNSKNYVIDANIPIGATTPADWIGMRMKSGRSEIAPVDTPASGVPIGFWGDGTLFDATNGGHYRVNGTKVVGAQQLAVANTSAASGTATSGGYGFVDAAEFNAFLASVNETKAKLNDLLSKIRTHGLIAT